MTNLPSVDIGMLTTTAQAVANLNVSVIITQICIAVVAIATMLKKIFPHIDGK